MRALGFIFLIWLSCESGRAHTVDQVYLELYPKREGFVSTIFIDAGYCLPVFREDKGESAPGEAWLLGLTEAQHQDLRQEAELYIRSALRFMLDESELKYQVSFPDYTSDPYDFQQSLVGTPILRVYIEGGYLRAGGSLQVSWDDTNEASLLAEVLWSRGDEEYSNLLQVESGSSIDLSVEVPPFVDKGNGDTPSKSPHVELRKWGAFIPIGFKHILPLGLDHILFVIGIFLYRPHWRSLIHQSLLFTLAHSITLFAAARGWIVVSSSWVEFLIAASIVAIAVENLMVRSRSRKLVRSLTIFTFGLLHGLGFASVLQSYLPVDRIVAPLLAFNVGIELGQVVVLCGCFALLRLAPQYERNLKKVGSIGIALIGLYWVIERTPVL